MAAPQTQTGATPAFYEAVGGGRRHTSPLGVGVSLEFLSHLSPCVGLQTHPPTGRVHIIVCTGPASSSLFPSLKSISGGKPIVSLLAVFPNLSRPASTFTPIFHLGNMKCRKMPKRYYMIRIHIILILPSGILICGGLHIIEFSALIASITVDVRLKA
jgi:hypothetical protein